MSRYSIETTDAPLADPHEGWAPFRVELPLNQSQAIALARTLAETPGARRSFRVVDGETGEYVVRLTRGTK